MVILAKGHVMKDFVMKARSFVVFDLPLQPSAISCSFNTTHNKYVSDTPTWSTQATKQKLIASYWFQHVITHFAFLLVTSVIVTATIHDGSAISASYCIQLFIAGFVSYWVMYLFHYKPCFDGNYLPMLETIKESYDRKQTEQVEKCRQAQLPNFTLTLLFYVFLKTSKTSSLQCNDHTAKLMTQLFGVDAGSLKKNLSLLLGKKQHLSMRKTTEIRNRFEEAFMFLEAINFSEGIVVLRGLEQRLLLIGQG